MAGASESYHEPLDQLSAKTKDMHRALVSVQEELEAVDWYQQRADAAGDTELRDTLLHNMREEVEHACMLLEWLRRNSVDFDEQMRIYLFTNKPILDVEEQAELEEAAEELDSGGKNLKQSGKNASSLHKFTIGDLKDG